MKKHISGMPNFSEITFLRALELARAISGKTYEQIAHEMELGTETVHQYFTNPDYNPPSKRIPKLCKALGNNIPVEWLVAQIGGHLVFEPSACDNGSIQKQVARLSKEFAEVLRTDADSSMDGNRTKTECLETARQVDDLIVVAESFKRQLMARRKELGK